MNIFTVPFLFVVLLMPFKAQSSLIDKIIAVVDDTILTLSEIRRIRDTLSERREILPQIYKKIEYSDKELAQIFVNSQIIKKSLNSLGYNVDDSEVEGRIKQLGVPKETLNQILESKGFKYTDYFEMIRTSIEHIIFYQQVIGPLVAITEQEIKNEFIKKESHNQTVSLKYNLVSYSITKDILSEDEVRDFTKIVANYRANRPIPNKFLDISVSEIGDIKEEGLNPGFLPSLKTTEEGNLSEPIEFNGQLLTFFVSKKDIVESELYMRMKSELSARLFEKRSTQIFDSWINRESQKYYIRFFI